MHYSHKQLREDHLKVSQIPQNMLMCQVPRTQVGCFGSPKLLVDFEQFIPNYVNHHTIGRACWGNQVYHHVRDYFNANDRPVVDLLLIMGRNTHSSKLIYEDGVYIFNLKLDKLYC